MASSEAAPSWEEVIPSYFEGSIQPPKVGLGYRLSLACVAVVMVLLPVLYLAAIAAVAWGVYYFCAQHFLPIWSWDIGFGKFGILAKSFCSLTPPIVGILVVVFMVKPLFHRDPPSVKPLRLAPEVEPGLHVLVRELARQTGAPMPSEIRLDAQLNASASFTNFASGFFRNQLTLTVGAPLVAALSARELAGVIAHELGHFAQGAGMRFSYIIRSVNAWFMKVIYQRDAWDDWLRAVSEEESHVGIQLVGLFGRAGVGFSRFVLKLLMYVGMFTCSRLLHQMEFDADAYETAIAGSAAMERTSEKLVLGGAAMSRTYEIMRSMWQADQRLPGNLSTAFGSVWGGMPEEVRANILQHVATAKAGWLDTHPSTPARVARARAANLPGVFSLDEPARVLFHDFDRVSRAVTFSLYNDQFQLGVAPHQLTDLVESAPA